MPTAEKSSWGLAMTDPDDALRDTLEAEIIALRAELASARNDVLHLKKFKAFVHQTLDRMGVPSDPPGKHRDEGCRVGQRLAWLDDMVILNDKKLPPEGPGGPCPKCGAAEGMMHSSPCLRLVAADEVQS